MTCPYCGSAAELKDSAVIYGGRSYGLAWICSKFPECDSYVGCHPGTKKPLGRLANEELRIAKHRAHLAFDWMWRAKIVRDRCSKKIARNAAYAWLARCLGIELEQCHIGMFDVETCNRVVAVCRRKSY
jgi:hypothetical protein